MGPTEREFAEFLRRYVPRFRVVIVCSCAVLAVPAMPVADMAVAGVVAAVAIGWSLLHLAWLRAGARPGALVAADLAVMTGLCLSQVLTVPATQPSHGSTWILVVVSFVAVGYQLTHPTLTGALAAVYLATADLAGVVLAGVVRERPDAWAAALPNIGWLLVQAALSRGLYVVVHRRGRAADAAAAEAARARRAARVAETRRAAERTHLATLHDTACATLLMASLPGASIPPDVVRRQSARDLRRLSGGEEPAGQADLVEELRLELLRHPVRAEVRRDGGDGPVPLWRPAVVALRDSCGEALRNVARHAGVDEARITVARRGDVTVVTIDDRGRGFDVAAVPEHRHGLSRSIVERMRAAGGRAEVTSRPGLGTRVRLEWPRA
ncbi:sensor histidine kinase [Streptomyces sp. TRM64462]|uniref:sensor histidine kinase n=1 Tax=Streptomyces sp. TRM64462 TaxID=2741726 RepID=UPI00158667AD|nr:ATP-binding protein [Streptomyces sp. TRM64462]